MHRWRWFKSLRLEDFLGPAPSRDEEPDKPERTPDRRAVQAEMLALQRLGRAGGEAL